MDWLLRYRKDFDELVTVVVAVHNGLPVPARNNHQKKLARDLKELKRKYRSNFSIDKKDIEQELTLMWYQYAGQFEDRSPKVRFKRYLMRRSIWGLRDWYKDQVKCQSHTAMFITGADQTTDFPFKLDLSFLLYNVSPEPLNMLSPYERYLIFLKFTEEKNILEIASVVQKDRGVVSRQLDDVITKLRRLYNAQQENTG